MNINNFVCVWHESGFETDSEGEDYNTSFFFDFTFHDSLEEAQTLAQQGNIGYAWHTGIVKNQLEEEDYIKPIYVSSILVYEHNILVGKYNLCDYDGWRYYEARPHWKDLYSQFISFPPQPIIKAEDFY